MAGGCVCQCMPTVDADGVTIAYEEHGPPDAETVVFVEGLGYGRWMWQWQADALAEDYHVLLYDNRGTGESDAPDGPYTIPGMAADLDAVLTEVLDTDAGETAHIVGVSMGGMIAMQYALDYDRAGSLSLLCTSHGGDDAVPIPDETLARMFNVPNDASPRESIRYKMRPAMTDEFWVENQDLIAQIVDWRLDSDASDAARGPRPQACRHLTCRTDPATSTRRRSSSTAPTTHSMRPATIGAISTSSRSPT